VTIEVRSVIRGLGTILLLSSILLLGSLLAPARITFWLDASSEYDFVVKGHLGGDHDRICGSVMKDGELWDSMTFKSGGARAGIYKTGLPLDAAKLAVEGDCR
jgi:hypothetical protein